MARYGGSLAIVLGVHVVAVLLTLNWSVPQAIELPPAAMMVELAPLPEPAPPLPRKRRRSHRRWSRNRHCRSWPRRLPKIAIPKPPKPKAKPQPPKPEKSLSRRRKHRRPNKQ